MTTSPTRSSSSTLTAMPGTTISWWGLTSRKRSSASTTRASHAWATWTRAATKTQAVRTGSTWTGRPSTLTSSRSPRKYITASRCGRSYTRARRSRLRYLSLAVRSSQSVENVWGRCRVSGSYTTGNGCLTHRWMTSIVGGFLNIFGSTFLRAMRFTAPLQTPVIATATVFALAERSNTPSGSR